MVKMNQSPGGREGRENKGHGEFVKCGSCLIQDLRKGHHSRSIVECREDHGMEESRGAPAVAWPRLVALVG